MGIQEIKHKIYLSIPKKYRRKIKNFYFNQIVQPLYNLKYRLYYGRWDFFDSIAIETTTHCNLRCKFCPNSKYERGLKKNEKLMGKKLFIKIINELAEIGYRGQILLHFYGEPLTDKRLPELADYTRKKLPKARIQINSNGYLLTIEKYKNLVKAGVDNFLITQYKDKMPPETKKTLDYIKNNEIENKITYRVLGEDIKLSNRGGEIKINKGRAVDYDRPICAYPNTAVHIDYQGNIVLCCNDYHSSVIFGNLKNEKLINIWNKENYKRLRKELKKGIFKLPICKKCVGIKNK